MSYLLYLVIYTLEGGKKMMQQEEKIQELERRIKVLENHASPKLPGLRILWFIIWGVVGMFLILTLIGVIQFVSA
jgi:hypothetical protein